MRSSQTRANRYSLQGVILTPIIACATLLLGSGCQPSSGGDAEGPLTSTGEERWPGGSLDGWDHGNEVSSFTRRDEIASAEAVGSTGDVDYASEMTEAWDEGYPSEAGEREAAGGSDGGGESAGSGSGSSVTPDSNQGSALEGGEIDDNEDLDAFLAYMESERDLYSEDLSIEWLDVSERQVLTVVDSFGTTVPDAKLTFWDEEGRALQIGRTRADGRFAFFPKLFETQGEIEVEVSSIHGSSQPVQLSAGSGSLTVELDGERSASDEINLEVAFIIDATGSMGGEINRLKETVTQIAERVVQPGVRLRLGAVAYRDRGDDYTTQAFNFTEDVAAFQQVINSLEANGGGDYPEALNEALHETQRRLSWTQAESLRLTFLITDAPAHHYEQQEFTYAQGVLDAQQMGMKIFPIASGGSDGVAELQLRQIAQHTLAHFIFVTEGGGSSRGSEGSDYHVDPAQFDVERLDDLVVRLINEELDAWRFETTTTPL